MNTDKEAYIKELWIYEHGDEAFHKIITMPQVSAVSFGLVLGDPEKAEMIVLTENGNVFSVRDWDRNRSLIWRQLR